MEEMEFRITLTFTAHPGEWANEYDLRTADAPADFADYMRQAVPNVPAALESLWPALKTVVTVTSAEAPAATPPHFAVRLTTTHDTNGNPRRGWAVYRIAPNLGRVGVVFLGFVEESYAGRRALDEWLRANGIDPAMCADAGQHQISPAQFRNAKKLKGELPNTNG